MYRTRNVKIFTAILSEMRCICGWVWVSMVFTSMCSIIPLYVTVLLLKIILYYIFAAGIHQAWLQSLYDVHSTSS